MKFLFVFFITALFSAHVTWLGNFNEAKAEAAKSHKLILVNFSGSDWCGPCIRERKEILETETFENFASEHLVLVRADFPRQKKNQLSKEQVKLNEALADKYNAEGKFPYTLLIDGNGKVLKVWDGFPNESAEKFVAEINPIVNASR
ncbi:MAG: Thioredoxin-related protein [Mucilaginibacter sp.]|nr:Thioredoxin-related protein [Mucilaginibacter sp.]